MTTNTYQGTEIHDIALADLRPHPSNPRRDIGDVTDLAASIKANGLLSPLSVVPDPEDHGKYLIIAGHRRYTAAKQAKLDTVPAFILHLDPRQQLEAMISENTQREQLTLIEEADACQGLLDLGATVKEIGRNIGRSDTYVRTRIKFARIPQSTRDAAKDFDTLTLDQLDKISEFANDPEAQQKLAKTGSRNFDYMYQTLLDVRNTKKWMQKALIRSEAAGITIHTMPEDKQAWNFTPEGTRFDRSFGAGAEGSFFKQLTDHYGTLLPENIQLWANTDRIVAYKTIPQAEIDQKNLAQKEAKAKERERNAKTRKFDTISRKTRLEWARTLRPGDKQRAKAIEALAALEFIGTGTYLGYFRPRSNTIIGMYNQIARPLPIKAVGENYYDLDCAENTAAIRKRCTTDPHHILTLMIARQEADITTRTWQSELKQAQAYYQIIQDLGYEPSDEEKQALAGAYLTTKES